MVKLKLTKKQKNKIKKWIEAALIRAIRTFAQGAIGAMSGALVLKDINILYVLSVASVSAIVSILMSLSGLPELNENNNCNTK